MLVGATYWEPGEELVCKDPADGFGNASRLRTRTPSFLQFMESFSILPKAESDGILPIPFSRSEMVSNASIRFISSETNDSSVTATRGAKPTRKANITKLDRESGDRPLRGSSRTAI